MKRRFRGLFGGKHIQFGNRISFSNRHTRRTWKPNVQRKRFWSEAKQRFLQFRATTAVIKQVKQLKHGIDEYLAKTANQQRNKAGKLQQVGLLYQKAIKIKANQRRQSRLEARAVAVAAMSPEERIAHGMPAEGIAYGWNFVPAEEAPVFLLNALGIETAPPKLRVNEKNTTLCETIPPYPTVKWGSPVVSNESLRE